MTQQQNKARVDKTLRMDDTTAKQNENGKKLERWDEGGLPPTSVLHLPMCRCTTGGKRDNQ